jgi:hypothetical protein
MNYYFDESGNWQELEQERRNLVIGGVVAKNTEVLIDLKDELDGFKFKNNLTHIHATELEPIKRWELYKIIAKYLENKTLKALFYFMNPSIFYSQTQKDPEDIYINVASELLSNIAFGDNKIKVEYDMKFHYAYPVKILESMQEHKGYDEFIRMSKNFTFKDEKEIEKQKNRLSKILSRLNIPVNKLNNPNFLYKYIWEEFRLKVESGARMREKFKERTLLKMEQNNKKLGLNSDIKLNIEYKGKHNQSVGVYVVDVLTNIVRYHGKKAKNDEVKDIYKYIKVKEITNGEI